MAAGLNVLILGSGGREHAIGLKLSQAAPKPDLIFAPGNPGMAALGNCFPVAADDIPGILSLVKKQGVDFTIVGPEIPLVKGMVDAFLKEGLPIFGPTAAAAQLEGSKAFAKAFMQRHKIPTAEFQTFDALDSALAHLKKTGAPVVVKTSGLAAGKGAVVCQTIEEAQAAIYSMLGPNAVFGEAGREVVIEEFMEGEEASVFAVCDGTRFALLPTAQDHKRIFEGDRGPNTGGMGAYSPAPLMTPPMLDRIGREIIKPTLDGMRSEGHPYQGILFVGIMVTPRGDPKVVEFNCRLGDPETQAVLPVYPGDLLQLFRNAASGKIPETPPIAPRHHAAVVVLASGGYPGEYRTGIAIEGVARAEKIPGVQVIHAGTRIQAGVLQTSGGRVLGIVGEAESLTRALGIAYSGCAEIHFEGLHFRRDIGHRAVKNI